MKKNELSEIKKLDIKALKERIKKSKAEYMSLVLERSVNKQGFSSKKADVKLTDSKALSKIRKETAQILTVIKQKQMLGALEETEVKGVKNGRKS